MTRPQTESNRLKQDQIRYFRAYISCFDINSREYALIKESITRLENSI